MIIICNECSQSNVLGGGDNLDYGLFLGYLKSQITKHEYIFCNLRFAANSWSTI